jgi:hypothetical protein
LPANVFTNIYSSASSGRDNENKSGIDSSEVEQAIRALGLAVMKVDGKWRINYRSGKESTAHYTTNDDDALGMARAMEVARGQQ